MGQKAEALRQRIVEAADQLFYQQGYEKTSFSDIADAVRISRGNFYYHFKTKDDILNAVIDNRIADIQKMFDQWEEKFSQPKQRILLYIDILTEHQADIKEYGCPAGSLCTELTKIKHAMHNDANRILALSRDWLVQQFQQLGDGNNAMQLAMHLLGRSQGIATIANTFDDEIFIQTEVNNLKAWLDEVTD